MPLIRPFRVPRNEATVSCIIILESEPRKFSGRVTPFAQHAVAACQTGTIRRVSDPGRKHQFQPHPSHFQRSAAFCFMMALPQRGQMRIQIRFMLVIALLLDFLWLYFPASEGRRNGTKDLIFRIVLKYLLKLLKCRFNKSREPFAHLFARPHTDR